MTTKTAVAVELSQPESRRPSVCTAEGRVSVLTQRLWKGPEDLEWALILESWNSLIIQDDRDPRVVGYLPRRATNVQWNQPKKKKCDVLDKAEQDWKPGELLDMELGIITLTFFFIVTCNCFFPSSLSHLTSGSCPSRCSS